MMMNPEITTDTSRSRIHDRQAFGDPGRALFGEPSSVLPFGGLAMAPSVFCTAALTSSVTLSPRSTLIRRSSPVFGTRRRKAQPWHQRLPVESSRRPGSDDCLCHFGNGQFALVVGGPACIFILIRKDGKHHRPGLARDDGHIRPDRVQAAGLARGTGTGLRRIELLQVARNG